MERVRILNMPFPVIITIVSFAFGLTQFFYYLNLLGNIHTGECKTKKQVLINLIPGKFLYDLYVLSIKTVKIFYKMPLK